MDQEIKQFLETLYNPGEEVCWSVGQASTFSVSQDKIDLNKVQLVAINPVKGKRNDVNVTAHRSILIELDTGTMQEQWSYVKKLGLPFSMCIFSGNKSLHFAITVEEDFSSYNVYYWTARWIMNIISEADSNTKNPSRCIRFPGVMRIDGKKQLQNILVNNGRIKNKDLYTWLRKFPNCEPAEYEAKEVVLDEKDANALPHWVFSILQRGVMEGSRNRQYFSVGCEFYKAGYSLEETLEKMIQYVELDNDFTERELKSAIDSAYRYKSSR